MPLKIDIEDSATNELQNIRDNKIPLQREQLVRDISHAVLDHTATANPVRSGRSRSGWNAASQQLTGVGYEGGGSSESNSEGSSTILNEKSTTTVTATNHVPYISFLEYGTSRMAPFSMLRGALAKVSSSLQNFLHR